MKRIGYSSLTCAALLVLEVLLVTTVFRRTP